MTNLLSEFEEFRDIPLSVRFDFLSKFESLIQQADTFLFDNYESSPSLYVLVKGKLFIAQNGDSKDILKVNFPTLTILVYKIAEKVCKK